VGVVPLGLYIFLYTEDVDATFAHAVEAGSQVRMPVTDQSWGDRYGNITDPFEHKWNWQGTSKT
jgi:uncharacterized glyoxalase superfamily protein PhnB